MEQQRPIWRSSSPPAVVRFGDFELDLRAAELRKDDQRIRLQEQPFQLLVELLEHAGQLVLREEIRRKLWPDNTIVEFDHSINAAVKRLRDALQDSAETPRYIETLARRGYRMIASVSLKPEKARQPGIAALNTGVSWPLQHSPPQKASVAVLPFTNISGDADNDYFCDGLAEELINELAHVPGLKVIARTSAFAFKGKQEDIRDIAGALGVAHVVEGSVRRSGSRIRISAQLIAAADGTHVWSERYDRELAAIFALQDEIAQAIATALRLHLSGTPAQYRPSLPAYEEYLKARNCLAAFTRESLPRSKEIFEQVITMDPGFALAQSGLAMALVTLVLPGIMAAQLAMPQAHAAARRALDIDPGLQEAHAVVGMVAALYEYDWEEAGRRFRLATVREPVAPYIRWHFSFSYLLPMGHARESVQECMRGLQDDPLNFMGGFHYAAALLAGGNADAGESYLRQLAELHSPLYQPWYLLALSKAVRGMHQDALSAAERAYSLAPWSGTTKGLFGGLLRSAGDMKAADQLHRELKNADVYGTAMGTVLFHIGCSELEQAADVAEEAIEQRDTRIVLLMGLIRAFRPDLFRLNSRWSAVATLLGVPTELSDEHSIQTGADSY